MVTIAKARIAKLEQVAIERHLQRFKETARTLYASMAPQHLDVIRAWAALPDVRRVFDGTPIPLPIAFARLEAEPPSLVRAAFEMILWTADSGAPLHLRPELARVYLEDPDAWARDVCAACGFLGPVRARRDGRGRLTVLATYADRCQECGSDQTGHFDPDRFRPMQPDARK